ncbi:alpha/beta fold hydrolase [Kitasatospora sp. HPMI-4]|uniref:alpha/beta fold hydrolase n=1 Tax=Kitasatospora sp. HPMI-4 TaxID=3448443 RepID=UPI003F1DE952
MNTYQTRVPVTGGSDLWAERAGAGTPVVLLHGAGHDSRLWDAVFPELARHHTVIRYDARGLGRSAPSTSSFWDVEDLRAVLDHFGLDVAAMAGLSMGGEAVLDFALAYPERVSALALIGASVSGHTWPDSPELSAYAKARRDRDTTRLAELELSIWAAMGAQAPGGGLITAMVDQNAERRVACESLALYPEQDAVSRLDRIKVPTLVVHGDRDHPEIGTIARRLAEDIPDARHETVQDADHYLPLRTPGRLTELLLAHLG